MSYASITIWQLLTNLETLDHVTDLMRTKYLPGLKNIGAERSVFVDIDLDRFAIVTMYPTKEVRDDALEHITQLRSEGAEEFGAALMDSYAGNVLAQMP